MVQVLLQGGWRAALPASGDAAARRAAAEQLTGVLAIQLDGVDLTGGRAEGPLLPALEALLDAVAALLGGAGRAVVPLAEGALRLILRRRGGEVSLALVELGPPARLLVRAVTVELPSLAAAALEASAELCRSLSPEGGAPRTGPALRLARLSSQVSRPARRRGDGEPLPLRAATPPAAPDDRPAAPGEPVVTTIDLTLDDELPEPLSGTTGTPPGLDALLLPGRLRLRVGAAILADLTCVPALALRDLVAGLEEAARSQARGERGAEIQLAGLGREGERSLRLALGPVPSTPPSPGRPLAALPLARATAAAVEALARLIAAEGDQPANAALEDLRAAAGASVAHLEELSGGDAAHRALPGPLRPRAPPDRPLSAGRLRRVTLRQTGQLEVGEPLGIGLLPLGRRAVAVGAGALAAVEPASGRVLWRAPGAGWLGAASGLLLAHRGEVLEALDPASGRIRWRHPLEAPPTGAVGTAELLVLAAPSALTALDAATGALRWRRPLPGADGLALARLGAGLVASASSAIVYGFSWDGTLAWRLRAPGPALAPALLVGGALASLHAVGGAAALLRIDPVTGARLGEQPLDLAPTGGPLRWRGGLALGGTVGGTAVLALVQPGRARRLEVELPLTGPPRLGAAGDLLVACDAAGGLAAVDARGRLRWACAPLPGGEAGGAPPWPARGLVLAASGGLSVLEAAGGAPLARWPGLTPLRLAATPALDLTVLEADGRVTSLALRGHLAVVG